MARTAAGSTQQSPIPRKEPTTMPTPLPIIPPIPAPDAIYKNDLGKTLAAQSQYALTHLPTALEPIPPVYFPPQKMPDDIVPPVYREEIFGQNVNNIL